MSDQAICAAVKTHQSATGRSHGYDRLDFEDL